MMTTKTEVPVPSDVSQLSAARRIDAPMPRRDFLKKAAGIAAGAAVGAAASSAASFLSACAPAQVPKTSRNDEKVQLVYQDWRTDWFPSLAQRMLAEFQSKNPNIRVYYSLDPPSESFNEKMIADFKSGTAPDVFQGCCSYFPIWEQEGYTLDLRPFMSDIDQAAIDDWDPVQFHALQTRDGKQYGLPKYHGALGLYYNKALFDRYHIAYPDGSWTHADYLDAMLAFRAKQNNQQTNVWGSMVDISWDRLQVHVNAWGGHFVNPEDNTKSMMAEQLSIEALGWLRERMRVDRVMAAPQDVQRRSLADAFISGNLAMIEDGSWSLKTILSNAEFPVGVAPFPAGPARKVTLTTTDGYGIYAGTNNPQAAWELLKFLVSMDYGREMARVHYLQPARASLVNDWINYIHADYPGKTKDMHLESFAESHQKGSSVVAEVFRKQEEAQRLANQAWQQIFISGVATVDLMQKTSLQIEQAQEG